MIDAQVELSVKPIRKLAKKRSHQIYKTDAGKRVVGASSICKVSPGESSDGLIQWGIDLALQGIDFKKSREESADVGTCAHFLIECHLEGAEADLSEYSPAVTDRARKAFSKFEAWWNQQHFIVMQSELQMVSNEHLYGGTLDIVASDNVEGDLVLIDIKVTKSHRWEHDFQAAGGYRRLYEETHPGEPISRCCILRIPPEEDAPIDPKWVRNMDGAWDVFDSQLEFLRRFKAYKKTQ
jgi:hypothetical protein